MRNFNQISYDYRYDSLLVVYQVRGYSAAAAKLSLTPSAVSHQIRSIENDLGSRLFIRKRNGLEPTPECEIVVKNIKKIKALFLKMEDDVVTSKKHLKVINIGVTSSAQSSLITELLPLLTATGDGDPPKIVVSSGTSEELCDRLSEHIIDLAVIDGAFESSKFGSVMLDTDYLTVVVSPSSKYVANGIITLSGLLSEKLILKPKGSGTRRLFESCLRSHGISPSRLNVIMEADSTDTIIRLVSGGYGISVLSNKSCEKYVALGSVVTLPLECVNMSRSVHVVYNRDSPAVGIVGLLKTNQNK